MTVNEPGFPVSLMNDALMARLEAAEQRRRELSPLLSDPAVLADLSRLRTLSREYAGLAPLAELAEEWRAALAARAEAVALASDSDPALREMAREELTRLDDQLQALVQSARNALLPRDPNDERNLFLEIRAGAGGDEAAIFAGDLFRMYSGYVQNRGWQIETMSASQGEHGGYKEIIARVSGKGAYSRLKYESGGHRVQRVPETETQGRIHTSACTVAILPEADEVDVSLNPADLRIDTFRASGAGGQHVNKTDSAIRITHLPSGLVVECQDERSQHKNKSRAMSVLAARLYELENRKQREKEAATRKSLIGSGDRSERIRTYNFPQGRITDHRINLSVFKMEAVMAGTLDSLLDPLAAAGEAERLTALGAT